MTKYLAVAAGSALGGMLRYYPGGTLLLVRNGAREKAGAKRDGRDSTVAPPREV